MRNYYLPIWGPPSLPHFFPPASEKPPGIAIYLFIYSYYSRMEENLRSQLENTFSTCRRSPRILERENRETPSTVIKQLLRSDIENSPEGN